MNPSELKYQVEKTGSNFFDRASMKFFGDTMRNYGVCSATIQTYYNDKDEYIEGGVSVEVWELYRKRPVKHGLQKSAYFDKRNFSRRFAITPPGE